MNLGRDGRELERAFADSCEGSFDVTEELIRESGSLVLVPPGGILEVGLGERPNDDRAAHGIQ
ncbi:MAG TPA: hypothetical protein VGD94_13035 [Vicinamibacterales bacterium]